MENPDTDLIFPPKGISFLSKERSTAWQDLVKAVEETTSDGPDQIAFILMMARLNNCATCNADSYRAIHGCNVCSKQALKRFHGSDLELSELFQAARSEVVLYLQNKL
jgi:hypothetical protein